MKQALRQAATRLAMGGALALLSAQPAWAVRMGYASNFAVLGATNVANSGISRVVGNLGVSPGSIVTGIGAGMVSGGSIHPGDSVSADAHGDAARAYYTLQSLTSSAEKHLGALDLGGMTLTPGVYHFDASAALSGTLTLDAQGDPNALFVFQVTQNLTTAAGSSVVVINSASGCEKVFWQVGGTATLGAASDMVGIIIASESVSLGSHAGLVGAAITILASVNMDSNDISLCSTHSDPSGDKGGAHRGNGDCAADGKDLNGHRWTKDGNVIQRAKGQDDNSAGYGR